MARNGAGELLSRANPLKVMGAITLPEAANRLGVSYDVLRMFLRYNKWVRLGRIGPVLFLDERDLGKIDLGNKDLEAR